MSHTVNIYQRISDDGRYGMTFPGNDGYCRLYAIVTPSADYPELEDYYVGLVGDPENFDYAVDVAEEEARCLLAQAREEFA